MRRLLILLLLLSSPALAQRGGSRIDVRTMLPTCAAITGNCPQNNYACVSGTSIYRCANPSTWTAIGGASAHSNGANCAAGEIPLGVDANGAVEGCYEPTEADITDLSHTTDTSAATACVGTSTYLDGEGGCDTIGGDISGGLDAVVVGNDSHSHVSGTVTEAGISDLSHFTPTDIDTDYAAETVTSAWTFNPNGTGANGVFDLTIGGTYGGLSLGNVQIYSSSFSASALDLDKAVLFRQGGSLGVGNDPGIEFAWMESGNTVRMAIPESGSGNATAMIRSVTVAGPYSAATGNAIVTCNQWSAFDTNIDCDTGATGADLFVQDDFEVEGTIFAHETINLEGATADGNQVILQVGADPGADVTLTLPTTTGTLALTGASPASKHTVCFTLFDSAGIATDDDIPSIWQAPAAITLTSIACEANVGTDITINVNQDSGCSTAALSTTNIESGDLQCGTTMTAGVLAVTAIADGDCFDAEVVSVSAAIRANICIEYTYD